MENKDIYSAAPGEGMETKGVPGYVPAPVVRSDHPQQTRSDDGDATLTADDVEPGTPAYANRNVDDVGRSEVTADPETGKSGRENASDEPASDDADAASKKTATAPVKATGTKTGGTKAGDTSTRK